MAQYNQGLVKVLSSNTRRWVLQGATTTGNIAPGQLVKFDGEPHLWFTVASLIDPLTFESVEGYNGAKLLDQYWPYLVTRDFTPNLSLPEATQGDRNTADIYTRAVRIIDTAVASGGGGGGGIPPTIVNAKGDLIAGTANDLVSRLAVGTNGQVLTADDTAGGGSVGLKWATPAAGGSGIPPSLLDAPGDLIVAQANDTPARLAVGANTFVLTADSTAVPLGVKWAAVPTPGPADDSITNAKLSERAGYTVIGNGIATTANPTDLGPAADGNVLRRSGSALAFGPVNLAGGATAITGTLPAANQSPPAAGSITDAMLRNSVARSVIGNATATGATPADIVAATDGTVLRRSGTGIGFGAVDLANTNAVTGVLPAANQAAPGAGTITDAMLRSSAAASVIGNATATPATPADIAATADGHVLRRSGTTLAFGALNLSTAGSVTGTLPAGNVDAIPATTLTTKGDLVARTITAPARVALGTDGHVLTVDSATATGVKWAAAPGSSGGIPASIVDAVGDLIVGTGPDAVARFAAGTNGQVLTANNALGPGLEWTTPGAASIPDDSITNAKLSERAPLTVIGNATNALANPTDIAAASDGGVLRRSGTALAFGPVNLAGGANAVTGVLPAGNVAAPAAGSITSAMLRDSAATSVIGRAGTPSGVPADIAAATSGHVLRLSGTTLGFGALDLANANAITGTLPAANVDAIPATTLTTKGDIIARTTTVPARLGVGTEGQVLTVALAQTTGLIWATPSAGTPADDSITNAKLSERPALTVIGNGTNATANPTDLAAGSDGHVLRRSGTTVAFGLVASAGLRDSVATSVIGRSANSTGVPADIAAATSGHVLRLSGTTLGFGAVDLANTNAVTGVLPAGNVAAPAAGSITDAMLRNSAATSVIGRGANSIGVPADITTTTNGNVLRRASNVLGFGALDLAGGAAAVTGVLPAGSCGAVNPALYTTKGDILAASGPGAPIRLGTVSDGMVLTARGSAGPGVQWERRSWRGVYVGAPNTVTTTGFSNFLATVTMPAGYANVLGTLIKVYCAGTYTSLATPGALNLYLNLEGLGAAFAVATMPPSQNNHTWNAEATYTVRATGAAGTIESAYGRLTLTGYGGQAPLTTAIYDIFSSTRNLTATLGAQISVNFDTGGGTTFILNELWMEVLPPDATSTTLLAKDPDFIPPAFITATTMTNGGTTHA